MSQYRYTIRRLLQIVPVLFGVFTITFFMVHALPGNPVRIFVGLQPSQALTEELLHQYGFDQPLWKQYLDYLWGLLHGDLGKSFIYHRPVLDLMLSRMGPTLTLMGLSYLISIPLSVFFGVYGAARHNQFGDHASRVIGLLGISTPNFWVGLMLITSSRLYSTFSRHPVTFRSHRIRSRRSSISSFQFSHSPQQDQRR